MPRRPKAEDDKDATFESELRKELDKLSRETETDTLLDALESELRQWTPEEEQESGKTIEDLNRKLIATSIFRHRLDNGYHEEMENVRPIESEVRKGLEDLRRLIDQGRPPSRR